MLLPSKSNSQPLRFSDSDNSFGVGVSADARPAEPAARSSTNENDGNENKRGVPQKTNFIFDDHVDEWGQDKLRGVHRISGSTGLTTGPVLFRAERPTML